MDEITVIGKKAALAFNLALQEVRSTPEVQPSESSTGIYLERDDVHLLLEGSGNVVVFTSKRQSPKKLIATLASMFLDLYLKHDVEIVRIEGYKKSRWQILDRANYTYGRYMSNGRYERYFDISCNLDFLSRLIEAGVNRQEVI